MTGDLTAALRAHFGFTGFRPGQAEAIQHLLDGQHTLVVMPTGAGKSLIYQFAALQRPGLTLVISPLIALMKDQVDSLTRHGIPATYINSALPGDEQAYRLQVLAEGAFRLAYVAPERLRSVPFQQALSRVSVSLLAVDEAHCISQWGHDFRPDYLHIAAARLQMGNPVTAALTATATPQVQDDIVQRLGLPSVQRIITGFNRPNLTFEVRYTTDLPAKLRNLRGLLSGLDDSAAIVYVGTRRDAEEVAGFIQDVGGIETQYYHAGLDSETRARIQDAFMAGELPVVVATNAFGMGIDRPDVRLVLHHSLPGTLEAYYQEAGRAGRDGEAARAVLLYDPEDRALQEWFIENDAPAPGEVRALYEALRAQGRAEVRVTTEDLSLATGLHEVKVKVGLAQLEASGSIQRLGDEGPRIWLRLGAWDEAAARTTAVGVAERRRHRRTQLAQMVAYAESNACRRRILLDHFGDRGPAEASRCCDNCLTRQSATSISPARDISSLSQAERAALIILDALHRLKWGVGRERLAQLLKGSQAKKMQQFGYDQNPYYGRLAVLRSREIEDLIGQLIGQGHLKVIGGNRPVLRLTPQGEAALRARAAIPLKLSRTVRPEALVRWEAERVGGASVEPAKARPIQSPADVATPVAPPSHPNGQLTTPGDIADFLSRSHPRLLSGPWQAGWALGFHGRFAGADWSRSAVGELAYRLKYQSDPSALQPLVEQVLALCTENPELADVDALVPVPPSTPRPFDPVKSLADALGPHLGRPVWPVLVKTRLTAPQKDMRTLAQKRANVAGAFAVQGGVRGKRLLVLDDLYDSGATLEEVSRVLRRAGVTRLYVLTLTRTIHTDR